MTFAQQRPRVLVIGGIDPCGGAGITADARMAQARGCDAAAVPTCLTTQNRHGFERDEPVVGATLRAMLDAVADDGAIAVVKTGWFADAAAIEEFASWFDGRDRRWPLVVDPVLGATVEPELARRGALVAAIRDHLIPRAAVLTPNRPELTALVGSADPHQLLALGCAGVLVKDGHGEGDDCIDALHTADGVRPFAHPRIARGPVHGTGCALATALACHLAHGLELPEACERAIADLTRCLRATPESRGGRPEPLRIV